MPVMDRSRDSRVVLTGVHEPSSKAVSIEDLSRVREPVSRSKSGVQGKVADVLHGRSRNAESQNEIKAFRVLAATARADAWQEQPFFLEYRCDGKRHRYTPDVLVAWGPCMLDFPDSADRSGLQRLLARCIVAMNTDFSNSFTNTND